MTTTTCCTTHDGPHIHGCVAPQPADGSTHDGACALTPPALPAEVVEDPAGWEEDEDYTLRSSLGLRPVAFVSDSDSSFRHPDRSACPAWCWAADSDDEHEIDRRFPMYAAHSSNTVVTAATHYQARTDREVQTLATWELDLEQQMRREPSIRVSLRAYAGGEMKYDHSRMMLSIDDAQDLVTVLQHLIAQADAAEALR